jgi:hypothetical protein
MTEQRHDNHSTEFGLWLRNQKEIESANGFLATNIDYVWENYKTHNWMMIEEKRYNRQSKEWQRIIFKMLDLLCRSDKNYKGFHYLVFENASPDYGEMFWDGEKIDREKLIKLLRFE